MSMLTTQSFAATPFRPNGALLLLAEFRRALNGWVATYIALHERRATASALRTMNERQLKDIGVYRGQSAAHANERLKRRIATM